MNVKDSYDYSSWGMDASLIYESQTVGQNAYAILFSCQTWGNVMDIAYSYYCQNSNNLFGCVDLRKSEYCILNKRYTKEEYEALVPKIKQHMNDMPFVDSMGRIYRYGEFFPPEHALFAYNESVAHDFFPKNNGEAQNFGARWRDQEIRIQIPTLQNAAVPDDSTTVEDTIIRELIECASTIEPNAHCTKVFKIVKQELAFYKRFGIPLPTRCSQCRQNRRLGRHNPFHLWSRQCQCGGAKSQNGVYVNSANHSHGAAQCPAEFKTSYAPERPDIVYCAECYQAEVV